MAEKNIFKERVEEREITHELRESYLDYAMSVIVSRALPDVRDGLKPVHRRILWAMWDMGLKHTAKFVKSARVVGECLGKYHPHGDMAVYDSLVRMAQDFSLRYPLIDGQGNFGSTEDNAAAPRYTEARLSKIAEELIADIDKETVDWQPNYDATRDEPKVFPAKLPNLLLNGTSGIAVGMTTSIPPHNLLEIADAIVYLTENSDADVNDLMKFVPGPDFPTGGIVYDKKSIQEAYATGKGTVTIRARAEVQEEKSGAFRIVITEIPYQVNKAELITKMAELVTDKKIVGVRDIRDESDREGLRIVVELKSGSMPQKILNQLYQYTDLQKNFYINMLALDDGIQPETFSLKEILLAYLDHRKNVIRRKTEFDLKKAEERAHILEGLVKALKDIDAVIKTIKTSADKDKARENLMKKFKFSEIQANAILEMKLQSLAALEHERIKNELDEKKKLIGELQLILKHPKKILEIIVRELKELKENFPFPRKTSIVAGTLKEFNEEDLIPKEDVIVVLTQDGYVKRVPPTAFRAQKRGGKGTIGFEIKEEDSIHQFIAADTHENILFFTDRGKAYQTKVHEIPVGSRTAKGKLVQNFLEIPDNEKISAVVSYPELVKSEEMYLVMVTKQGIMKKTDIKNFLNVRRSGIIGLTLKQDDSLRWVKLSSGKDEFLIATERGQAIRFREKDIRPMSRSASGVRAIRLRKSDFVAGCDIIQRKDSGSLKDLRLLTVTELGFGKQTPVGEYKVQKRGGSGIKTAKITEKTGRLIGAHIVNSEIEEVLAFSSKGQVLKTPLKNIREASRATQGVRIMNLEKNDSLIGIVSL